jgi:hypothetical protein
MTLKRDRSMGLRMETPELTTAEFSAFRELQGINSIVLVEPMDEVADAELLVEKNRETKTHSQRLRNAIYALHKTKLENKELVEPDFQRYYEAIMESFISKVKEQLEEYGQ